MRHRLGLATRTQISVCKLPFPSAGTAVSLFIVWERLTNVQKTLLFCNGEENEKVIWNPHADRITTMLMHACHVWLTSVSAFISCPVYRMTELSHKLRPHKLRLVGGGNKWWGYSDTIARNAAEALHINVFIHLFLSLLPGRPLGFFLLSSWLIYCIFSSCDLEFVFPIMAHAVYPSVFPSSPATVYTRVTFAVAVCQHSIINDAVHV